MTENLLFTPITLPNGTTIKNRFFKSAMSEGMGTREFQPKKNIATLYKRWAEGGTGLIITGNIMVDPKRTAEPGNIVFDKNSNMEILKNWANQGQQHGAKVMVQLNHPGKQAPKTVSKQTVAPSAVPLGNGLNKLFSTPRALTTSEVEELVQKFVTSAKVAKEAGFSGVQIHAAHGYLISQFLSPHDNRRTDKYGGSLENRMRFLVDVYNEMREKVGKEFPIGLKINSSDFSNNGFTEEESIIVIKKMSEIGVDLIEISGGNYENSKMLSERGDNEKVFFIDYAKKVLSLIDTPIVVTGGFKKVETMQKAIEKEKISMIGIARPIVIYPNLPNEIKEGNISSVSLERLTTGFRGLDKKLGGLIGLSYYEQQIRRLAENKPVKIHKNAWSPLLFIILYHGKNALKLRRR